MQTESCSLSLQSFLPTEIYLTVVSTLPVSLKGALVLITSLWWGMLDVRCPETWQEATEHVTFRWRPLLPETPVATEIEQQPPEGARKESLFSVGIFRAPPRGGTPPGSWARKPQDLFLEEMMLLRSGLFEADCEARRAAPQSLRGGARLATLSFCASRLKGTGPGWDRVADINDSWARRGRNLTNASS